MDPGRVARASPVSGQAPPQPVPVVRGDDRHRLDGHNMQLEAQAGQRRELDRPGIAWPGSRIEQLLRLAEEQVTRIVQESRAAADELRAAAKADAAGLRAAAENEASELRAAARRETDDLRGSAEREADAIRASARREAGELTSALQQAGIQSQLMWVDGADHDFVGANLSNAVAAQEAWIRHALGI